MKFKTLLIASTVCFTGISFSQSIERSVIGSAGGFSSAGGVQLSWTAGETVVNTATAGSVILTQGFQQPDQTSSHVVSVEANKYLNVFPNPSSGMFSVASTDPNKSAENLNAMIFDGAGKLVANMKISLNNSGSARLDLTALPGGVYTLSLAEQNQSASVFRLTVIK